MVVSQFFNLLTKLSGKRDLAADKIYNSIVNLKQFSKIPVVKEQRQLSAFTPAEKKSICHLCLFPRIWNGFYLHERHDFFDKS